MDAVKNKIYETEVVDIGSDAQEFKEVHMLIFFGDEAPDVLRSSCFIIKVNNLEQDIEVGQTLQIGDDKYKITAVGNEANRNLKNLGHVAVKFTGDKVAEMPGSLYVEEGEFPKIEVGTKVQIY